MSAVTTTSPAATSSPACRNTGPASPLLDYHSTTQRLGVLDRHDRIRPDRQWRTRHDPHCRPRSQRLARRRPGGDLPRHRQSCRGCLTSPNLTANPSIALFVKGGSDTGEIMSSARTSPRASPNATSEGALSATLSRICAIACSYVSIQKAGWSVSCVFSTSVRCGSRGSNASVPSCAPDGLPGKLTRTVRAAYPRRAAREGRKGTALEALKKQKLAQVRRVPFQHLLRRLRRHVARAKTPFRRSSEYVARIVIAPAFERV